MPILVIANQRQSRTRVFKNPVPYTFIVMCYCLLTWDGEQQHTCIAILCSARLASSHVPYGYGFSRCVTNTRRPQLGFRDQKLVWKWIRRLMSTVPVASWAIALPAMASSTLHGSLIFINHLSPVGDIKDQDVEKLV